MSHKLDTASPCQKYIPLLKMTLKTFCSGLSSQRVLPDRLVLFSITPSNDRVCPLNSFNYITLKAWAFNNVSMFLVFQTYYGLLTMSSVVSNYTSEFFTPQSVKMSPYEIHSRKSPGTLP